MGPTEGCYQEILLRDLLGQIIGGHDYRLAKHCAEKSLGLFWSHNSRKAKALPQTGGEILHPHISLRALSGVCGVGGDSHNIM